MKVIGMILAAGMMLAGFGASPAAAQSSACGDTYTIQPGDYLTEIAQRCGVSYTNLLAANPQITNPSLIHPNDVIEIPAANSGGNNSVPVTGDSLYITQPGDSVASIADRFGVTVAELVNANPGLTGNSVVYPGQRVTLPQGADRVPTVRITPRTGEMGTLVTLSATGFRANQPVEVQFGRVGQAFSQLDETTTDANGAVYQQFTIPTLPAGEAQDGQYAFLVARKDDPSINAVSNPFYLTGTGTVSASDIPVTGGAPYYVVQLGDSLSSIASMYGMSLGSLLAANPAVGSSQIIYPGQRLFLSPVGAGGPSESNISVSAQTARPGDMIQVRASDFPANAIVDVRIARQGQRFTGVVDGQADTQGVVTAQIRVPDSARAGDRWVISVTTTEIANGVRVVSQPILIR